MKRSALVILLLALPMMLGSCRGRSDPPSRQPEAAVPDARALPATLPPPTAPATSQPDAVAQPTGPAVTAVTWNILFARRGTPEAIAAAVGARGPDVVFLQECPPPLAARIAGFLRLHVADVGPLLGPGESIETAILCRVPLRRVGLIREQGRVFAVQAIATLGGRDVHLVCVHQKSTHPGSVREMAETSALRMSQTTTLLEATEAMAGAVVMGGDFNEGATSLSMERLGRRFAHAFSQAGHGSGITFPDFAGGLQIDHVYCTRDLAAVDCFVAPAGLSDHRMVVARLRFMRPQPETQSDE
ncbi:MAG: hypothetical protein BIFFINMI_02260 [Phycisphaerae bacterium]|nr:hypothetical protein [Phycisphaerae bacterium]